MMFLLTLARKSLANRLLATSLTLASIALSVALLLGIVLVMNSIAIILRNKFQKRW